jgi:predicted oxidoreductase (fatty acid repression mutant protein)
MLQQNEIKQRFGRIERNIEEAVNTCQADTKLPQKLKDCVTQWKQHAAKAKSIFESQNNKEILLCVDDLEKIGERAEVALRDVVGDDSEIRNFVHHAHTELSDLRKKLH